MINNKRPLLYKQVAGQILAGGLQDTLVFIFQTPVAIQ